MRLRLLGFSTTNQKRTECWDRHIYSNCQLFILRNKQHKIPQMPILRHFTGIFQKCTDSNIRMNKFITYVPVEEYLEQDESFLEMAET